MTTHSFFYRNNAGTRFTLFFTALITLCAYSSYARSTSLYLSTQIFQDNSAEEKIDYILRIYFSGKKKDDLNVMILTTLQDLEGAQATTSVAKQYAFLSGIKDKANACESACDILEILAVGAYTIDAKEAAEQSVLPPGNTAKANAGDALQSINNTFGNLNSSVGNTAYDTWVLSSGRVNTFGAANTTAKIAGTANTVAVSVSAGTRVFNEGKKIFTKIGGNGPCKKVPQKDIAIGKHEIPQQGVPQQKQAQQQTSNVEQNNNTNTGNAATTVISIPGITSSALRSLTDAVETRPGVQAAARNYNETLSTITVTHSGSTDDLADWIEDKFGTQYKLVGYSAGKISIAPKGK